jgi:hypothetical protein
LEITFDELALKIKREKWEENFSINIIYFEENIKNAVE